MFAPEILSVLLAAIAVDAYAGSPLWRRRWRWQPLVAAERLCAWFPARLDRESRGPRALRFRGGLSAAVLCAAGLAGGAAVEALAARQPLWWAAALFVFAGLVDQREGADALRRLGRALAVHDRGAAEAAFALLSPRDPAYLDSHGMAREGVEAFARRLSRRWTAPVLYAALAGAPGIAAYWLIDRLAAASGRGAFGAAPRAARRVLRHVPDALAGLALAAAASSRAPDAFAGLRGAAPGDRAPAALAGALGVALGGPRRYAARTAARPWIGGGRPQVGPNDTAAALRLRARAVGGVSAALGVICLVRVLQGA